MFCLILATVETYGDWSCGTFVDKNTVLSWVGIADCRDYQWHEFNMPEAFKRQVPVLFSRSVLTLHNLHMRIFSALYINGFACWLLVEWVGNPKIAIYTSSIALEFNILKQYSSRISFWGLAFPRFFYQKSRTISYS